MAGRGGAGEREESVRSEVESLGKKTLKVIEVRRSQDRR